jgi:predicted O-methyltransferase YrrM
VDNRSRLTTPERVRAVIDRLLREGTVVARDGSTRHVFPIAIPAEVGKVLRTWVGREDARTTIEIGLAYGMSALHICEALVANGHSDARHVAIDPFQTTGPDGGGFARSAFTSLAEAGLVSMVEHIEDESQIVLPRLLSEGRSFDFGFIDGNHRFERVFLDLYYLGRLIRPGGVVVLDDYDLPGIAKAVAFYTANLGWTLEDTPARCAVVRTSREEDRRHFSDFVEF